ncbi:MAG TPA: ParB/RepB/Spo0J family partition protein [Nitrospinota bacterium]|nr:ParB/RepB/Spo0J family partition protein [Nitrospinota bacterium]|tara:strand:- start:235330 stop:236181 length:852 start_codon:yes stop_codon:yes gene_type:complete
MKRKALGRGLDALIPSKTREIATGERIESIAVDEIRPNRDQPRTVFDQDSLLELSNSIKERGVIQPIIVTKKRQGYELVAGERRWRSVKLLGIKEIPAIVRVVRDSDSLELALIENIQREDLNPIEEAIAYEKLLKEYALTQEMLSKKVGKNRSSIANFLRLLKLPDQIKDDLSNGRLTMGHARALLSLETDQERMALRDQIINLGLNVRQTEDESSKRKGRVNKTVPPQDIFLERVRLDLERKMAAKVEVKASSKKGGVIKIRYTDVDDLNRIIALFDSGHE